MDIGTEISLLVLRWTDWTGTVYLWTVSWMLVGVGVLVISDMNSDEAESWAGAGPGQGSTGLQCYYGAPLLPPSLVIQHA